LLVAKSVAAAEQLSIWAGVSFCRQAKMGALRSWLRENRFFQAWISGQLTGLDSSHLHEKHFD